MGKVGTSPSTKSCFLATAKATFLELHAVYKSINNNSAQKDWCKSCPRIMPKQVWFVNVAGHEINLKKCVKTG
jgi:hypothetical protein